MQKKQGTELHCNRAQKQNKNFMYNDLKRSNCYGSDFSGSNFNFTSFRGAHFKSCNFFGCSFENAEFIGTNFKKSKFKRAKFKDAIFEEVNLSGVDFKDAEFENVIFLSTNISEAKNINIDDSKVKIFEERPEMQMSEELEKAIKLAITNDYVRDSRVLDTKEGDINTISIMILKEKFNEKILVSGLKLISEKIDKEFCTLSYIIKAINTYEKQGIL